MARTKKIPDACLDAADYTETKQLPQWAIEDLKKSGLSDETIKLTGCFPILSSDQLKELIGFSTKDGKDILTEADGAYCIPYYDDDFSKTRTAKKFNPSDPPCYYRIRLHKEIIAENGEKVKYLSPTAQKASPYHAYYLPGERAKFRKMKGVIYIVEGEKKAMKLAQELKLAHDDTSLVIGFPSVNNWHDWPGWESLKTSGKAVYIVFDAQDYGIDNESQANPAVQTQATKLWLFLTYQKKAANVKIVVWENSKEFKGIDDYLTAHPEGMTNLTEGASDPFEIFPILTSADGHIALSDIVASLYLKKAQYTSLYEAHNLQQNYGLTTKTWQQNMAAAIKRKSQAENKKTQAKEKQAEEKIPEIVKQHHLDIYINQKHPDAFYVVDNADDPQNEKWIVTPKGVISIVAKKDTQTEQIVYIESLICSDPIYISERLVDIFQATSQVKIVWGTPSNQESRIIPTEYLTTKNIDNLTKIGIRILSTNANAMVKYFLYNLGKIELKTRFASRNGWLDDDCTKFVLGQKILTAGSQENIARYEEGGLELSQKGSREQWLAKVKRYFQNPYIALAMATSAASFLANPLNVDGSILHLWADTCVGKSTASMFAASLWGQPIMNRQNSIRHDWGSNLAFVESYFEEMNHLCCFLEESTHTKDKDTLRTIVKRFVNGGSKGRGTVKHGAVVMAHNKTWQTMLISTGERKISDASSESGLNSRVMEIRVKKVKELNQSEFQDMNAVFSKNFGFGIELIQYWLTHQEEIHQLYQMSLESFEIRHPDIADGKKRCLPAVALIATGLQLLESVFGLTIENENHTAFYKLYEEILDDNSKKGSQDLYDLLVEYYLSNQNKFGIITKMTNGKTSYVAGSCQTEELGVYRGDMKIVCFYPKKLEDFLAKHNKSPSDFASLKERGLLKLTKNNGYIWDTKIRGLKTEVYGVKIDIVETDDNDTPTDN